MNYNTRVLGKRIYSYNQVESTNRIAYQLAEQGAKEGTVVIAKKQTPRGKDEPVVIGFLR